MMKLFRTTSAGIKKPQFPYSDLFRGGLLLVITATLSACGGGAETEASPDLSVTSTEYSGPVPATADTQSFRATLWEGLRSKSRCGRCHNQSVGQSPTFVRSDDINLAYRETQSSNAKGMFVNLQNPAASRLVTKAASGHNCWDPNPQVCGETIISYINNWIGSTSNAPRQIDLKAPIPNQLVPGSSKIFPADTALFSNIHNLLVQRCSNCHSESAVTAQAPYFANSDINAALRAAKSKIDLDNPANSRLVVRLRNGLHNCWSSCKDNADEMQAAISDYARPISPTPVNSALVPSRALRMEQGLIASGGQRQEANIIALYEFQHIGSDSIAYDTSGVEPALNLSLSGEVNWLSNFGIEIVDGKAQGKTEASKKLYDLIRATGEYTIEAWLVPANVTQEGPARIISYSAGNKARNFTLGQTLYNYNFLHRSSSTDLNGSPDLSTNDDDERLQATLQHVVLTYDPGNGRRIYVNAEYTGDTDPVAPGNLKDWDDSYALILGNEASGDQQWQGRIRMLAIHNRALTQVQIQQNFDAGVGQMLFMLFNISHLVDVPDSYIMFEMSRFDDYSYMFAKPTYVTLGNARPTNIRIKGIRLGINGSEAAIGQAWINVDSTLNAARYTQTGQQLSPMGTIVPLEKGADNDEFFLTFDIIGTHTNAMSRGGSYSPAAIPAPAPVSDIGLRTFEEINNTMAEVTGVTAQTDDGRSTYSTVRQQLPAVANIEGFVSAHQVAITQLAFDYCSSLVENADLRSAFFGSSINFNTDVATAFAAKASTIDTLASRLYNNMIGSNIASAPTYNEIDTELSSEVDADNDGIGDSLYEQLTSNCPTACDAARTRSIVKGLCTAVLGSAAMLIQ
ncbi:FIG00702062: hypothetical protein [hydrothermal vent metagenome]|uniref:ATPase n=1 Tax=hydrothermal vent metagenome TaxID=652676 RepID=A0A3B1C6E5_9ZZZZ